MDPRGRESDPMASMRTRGDPKATPSSNAYFHQVFSREGGTLPTPFAAISAGPHVPHLCVVLLFVLNRSLVNNA